MKPPKTGEGEGEEEVAGVSEWSKRLVASVAVWDRRTEEPDVQPQRTLLLQPGSPED